MGNVKAAAKAIKPAINFLLKMKCKKIILGCTELPIVIDENYFQDKKGESSSNFKKFGKNWWSRRMQAHEYMDYLLKKNNLKYENLDYSITKLINLFL